MTQTAVTPFTAQQVAEAEKAAQTLETLVERLGSDESFAAALKDAPRKTLADSRHRHREGVHGVAHARRRRAFRPRV